MASSLILSVLEGAIAFGEKTIFENLTFHIHENDKICLVGRNGSGKSTLMNVITGDKELDAGERWQLQGVKVDTGAYGVWRQGKPESWHASQSITVHGVDAVALLKLAGAAQAQGVTVQQLGWRLSPAAAQAAQVRAQDQALASLKARADKAAAVLGLHLAYFRQVTLGPPPALPGPRVMMAMAAPVPVAASSGESVTQSVSAIAVLEP